MHKDCPDGKYINCLMEMSFNNQMDKTYGSINILIIDLKIPPTTDEFYYVLKAFKNKIQMVIMK